MSKSKMRIITTRGDAAQKLEAMAKQLRDGTIALENQEPVIVPTHLELNAEVDKDEVELKLRWRAA